MQVRKSFIILIEFFASFLPLPRPTIFLTKSCKFFSFYERLQCVEGCRCPPGQVLDEENNECVMISMCKCSFKGMEFNPGYKEVRAGVRYLELCTCVGGQWKCLEAKEGDSVKFPPATDMTKNCSLDNNEVFTTCEPAEPVTCKNMHLRAETSTAICRAGCKCKTGYVLDMILKKCVLPEKCGCHHGGRSYNDGEKIKEDCNTWQVTFFKAKKIDFFGTKVYNKNLHKLIILQ